MQFKSHVTLLHVISLSYSVFADFSVFPSSQFVCVGDLAQFQCQYLSAHTTAWRVNGILVGRTPLPNITYRIEMDSNNRRLDILSILGIPEYNRLQVECVAIVPNGSVVQTVVSPPVFLVINSSVECIPDSEPKFIILPGEQTVVQDEAAEFQCQHSNADVIGWMLNDEPLNSSNITTSSNILDDGGVVHRLTVIATAEYNSSRIVCLATFLDGSRSQVTAPATLLIQGLLHSVSNLRKSSNTLNWTPPFSLDLTGVDPDIVYCVDVYNITCGRRDLIISDCNVTEPSYTSDDIAPDGYIYEYIVTPRSNVPGARNGTPSQPLRDQFSNLTVVSFLPSIPQTSAERAYYLVLSLEDTNLRVGSWYILSLFLLDDSVNMDSVETNICRNDNLLTLKVVRNLLSRRLWNCTVLANGCHPVSSGLELSTHDIQNISVSSPLTGTVRVTGDFIQGSTATGLLVIVYSLSDDSDVHYHSTERDDQHAEISVSGLPGSQYGATVFVLDNDLPFPRAANLPKPLHMSTIMQRSKSQPRTINYELHVKSTGICITCTFLDSSTTDCVAVVHQRISRLSSSGLMNIESSHKFNRSGDTAYGCIEGISMDGVQVGVIEGVQITSPTATPVRPSQYILTVIAILCISFVIILAVSVVLLIVCLKKRKIKRIQREHGHEQEIELEQYPVGDVINHDCGESSLRGFNTPNITYGLDRASDVRTLVEPSSPLSFVYDVTYDDREGSQNDQDVLNQHASINNPPAEQQRKVGDHYVVKTGEYRPTLMIQDTDDSQSGSENIDVTREIIASTGMPCVVKSDSKGLSFPPNKTPAPIQETYSDMDLDPSYDENSTSTLPSMPLFKPEGATHSSDSWCNLPDTRVHIEGPKIMLISPNVLVPCLSESKTFHEENDTSRMCGKEYSQGPKIIPIGPNVFNLVPSLSESETFHKVEDVNVTTQEYSEMVVPRSRKFTSIQTEVPCDDGRRFSGITLFERSSSSIHEMSSLSFSCLIEEEEVTLYKCDSPLKTATENNDFFYTSEYINSLCLRIPNHLADISTRKVLCLESRHCLMDSDFHNEDATAYPRDVVTLADDDKESVEYSHINDEFDMKDSQQPLMKIQLQIEQYDVIEAGQQEPNGPHQQIPKENIESQFMTVCTDTDGYDKKKVRKKTSSENDPGVSNKTHVEQPDTGQILAVKLMHGLLSNVRVTENKDSFDVQSVVDYGGIKMKLETIPNFNKMTEAICLYLAETAVKEVDEPPTSSDQTEDDSNDEQSSLISQPEVHDIVSVVHHSKDSSDELIEGSSKQTHVFNVI